MPQDHATIVKITFAMNLFEVLAMLVLCTILVTLTIYYAHQVEPLLGAITFVFECVFVIPEGVQFFMAMFIKCRSIYQEHMKLIKEHRDF